MFKKKDKDEEKRKKEQKQRLKDAKKEAKEKEVRDKEAAKRKKREEKELAQARREGYVEGRKPEYNVKEMVGESKDIWEAAKKGNLPKMQEYIEQGLGVGARDSDGCTALHYAAEYGHISCLQWILALHKLDVNVQDRWGMTPLHKATFAKQQASCEWLVLRGADLHILTEGGISPIEKAFEHGEEFAAALLTNSVIVEENGILVEDKIEVSGYSDMEVKWGEKTIYVDKDTNSSQQEFADIPEAEIIAEPAPQLSLQQQKGLAQAAELAGTNKMQEALIKTQLELLTEEKDACVIPELRELKEPSPTSIPPIEERLVKTTSSYDILTSTKRAVEQASVMKDIPMEFSKRFDMLSSSTSHFVFTITSQNSEEKATKLNLALKGLVIHLQSFFQVVHAYANTKFNPMERGKIIKCATEIQLAIQNMIQGVKGRNNALPQFLSRAEEKLLYFTQILVASIWNMHVASEYISEDLLIAEVKEYSAVFKEIVSCALGQSSQSFTEITCYAKLQAIQTILLLNCKVIEIYNSKLQQELSDISFTIAKGTRGILMAAEHVKTDKTSTHRETMSKLAKLLHFKIIKVSELLSSSELHSMFNFLDENIEKEVILDGISRLVSCVKGYANKEREIHNEELEIISELKAVIGQINRMYKNLQPDSYSQYEIIGTARRISAHIDRICICSLSFLGDAASDLLEKYLVRSLQSCIYFSNQVKIVACSHAVSYEITTKMMLPLSIRSMCVCLVAAIESVEQCITIFDNPFDFDMDAILDSLPIEVGDDVFDEHKKDELAMMGTIRSTKRVEGMDRPLAAVLPRPSGHIKTVNANMQTIRKPRRELEQPQDFLGSPVNTTPAASVPDELDELANIEPHTTIPGSDTNGLSSSSPLDELDALVNLGVNTRPSEASIVPISSSSSPLDELDALVNLGVNTRPSEASIVPKSSSSSPLDELEALVNLGVNTHSPLPPAIPVSSSPLDELDALVNLDMHTNSNSTFLSSSSPSDELDALVNLGARSQTPHYPVSRNIPPLSPLDELDVLVNLDGDIQPSHEKSFHESENLAPSFSSQPSLSPSNSFIGIGNTPDTDMDSGCIDSLDELFLLVQESSEQTQSNELDQLVNLDDDILAPYNTVEESAKFPNQQHFTADSYNELDQLVNLTGSASELDQLDYVDPMDELDQLVNLGNNRSPNVQPFPADQSEYRGTDQMCQFDELDQLVNLDPSRSELVHSSGNHVDPMNELDQLVNLGINNRSPNVQPFQVNQSEYQGTNQMCQFDELDQLVNLDPPRAELVHSSGNHVDPMDELDQLVNLSILDNHAPSRNLDPIDELDQLVNINSRELPSFLSSTAPIPPTSEEIDPLEELTRLAMGETKIDPNEIFDPLEELNALANM